jgi:methionine synthase II (cobalamin-independent)
MPNPKLPKSPRILTTTVGSYPVPDWLAALPSEQAVIDATRVVFDIQRQAGIDLPTGSAANPPGSSLARSVKAR